MARSIALLPVPRPSWERLDWLANCSIPSVELSQRDSAVSCLRLVSVFGSRMLMLNQDLTPSARSGVKTAITRWALNLTSLVICRALACCHSSA